MELLFTCISEQKENAKLQTEKIYESSNRSFETLPMIVHHVLCVRVFVCVVMIFIT